MSTYGHLLRNWESHSPRKMLADISLIAFDANLMMTYLNNKTFYESGEFKSVSLTIANAKTQIEEDNEEQFQFYIEGIDQQRIELGLDQEFDWIRPNSKLCSLGYIEDIHDDNTELILHFAYEYLKLNPDDLFWFEDDWAYSLDDLQRIQELPFDKDWCFKPVVEINSSTIIKTP